MSNFTTPDAMSNFVAAPSLATRLKVPTLIVADDLTGACDAALPFLGGGRSVAIGVCGLPDSPADVLAVSTETRALPAAGAAARVEQAMGLHDVGLVIKKVDSRLRGPVGAELEAALRRSGARAVVLAPALPRLGRTVEEGVLRVPGAEWVDVASRLGETSRLSATLVGRGAGAGELLASITEGAGRADVVICDSLSEGDLATVAEAIHRLGVDMLPAGTSALTAALAGSTDPPPPELGRPVDSVLFVMGSLESSLRRQVELLIAKRDAVCVPLANVADPLPPGSEPVVLESIRSATGVADGGAKAGALGAAAASILSRHSFDAVICAGGAVAAGVCRQLGIAALELVGALGPGFAVARTGARPRLLALRSGSFGADDDLVVAYDRLKGAAG